MDGWLPKRKAVSVAVLGPYGEAIGREKCGCCRGFLFCQRLHKGDDAGGGMHGRWHRVAGHGRRRVVRRKGTENGSDCQPSDVSSIARMHACEEFKQVVGGANGCNRRVVLDPGWSLVI